MNDIDFLYTIANRVTNITLANALGLFEDAQRHFATPVVLDFSTMTTRQRADHARTLPAVTDYIEQGRFIQAIKEFRTISGLGLKETKDALDLIKSEFEQRPAWQNASVVTSPTYPLYDDEQPF